jgi:hypothetical protein
MLTAVERIELKRRATCAFCGPFQVSPPFSAYIRLRGE